MQQPTSNYTGTGATPGTGYGTGTGTGTNMNTTGMTGTNTGMTGTQQPRKEGMVGKVKDMVGLGHKDHHTATGTTGTTATGVTGHHTHHGIVPPGAPSKEDHTLYKKGSSSSSSSSDEDTTRKERVVGTETLEQRGIPRTMPAEHVREGTTNLPVQRIPAPADALQSNVAIPTRMPSEHVYDERPGMYNGPTEYVNQATTGVQGMNIGGQKTVTAVGAEADRLEQRDRMMGRHVEKDGAHTYADGARTGTGTGAVPLGNTGATMGTGTTTGATTGTGLKEPLQGKMTGQKMHDSPAGVLGYGGATAKTDAVETNQAGTGLHGTHDPAHKPSMIEKVKGLLPGHHKH